MHRVELWRIMFRKYAWKNCVLVHFRQYAFRRISMLSCSPVFILLWIFANLRKQCEKQCVEVDNQTRHYPGHAILTYIDITPVAFCIARTMNVEKQVEWFTPRCKARILYGWLIQTPVLRARRKRTSQHARLRYDDVQRSRMQPRCKLHGRLPRLGSVATSKYNLGLREIPVQDGAGSCFYRKLTAGTLGTVHKIWSVCASQPCSWTRTSRSRTTRIKLQYFQSKPMNFSCNT